MWAWRPKRFFVEKKIGETPLEALERERTRRRIPREVPMTYAGRLDPMASGKLLILVGDECKAQEKYHGLDKEYEIEVLLGVASDTGDILGIPEEKPTRTYSPKEVLTVLCPFVGPYTAPYPVFSSKTVNGKPLFEWALEGRLTEIDTPVQDGIIRVIHYRRSRTLSTRALLGIIESKIGALSPIEAPEKTLGRDFRKDEVRAAWKALLAGDKDYTVLSFRVRTSAGVYMRTLARDIGEALGTTGLALSIHRTKIFL